MLRNRRRAFTVLVIGAALAVVPAVGFAWYALDSASVEIAEGRLREAELLAARADAFVSDAFRELDDAAAVIAEATRGDTPEEYRVGDFAVLRAIFALGVYVVENDGTVSADLTTFDDGSISDTLAAVLIESGRNRSSSISQPFAHPLESSAAAALAVPIYRSDGAYAATLVGIVDLTGSLASGLVEPALRIGATGHADLVDERGTVLVSTNPAHRLGTGDHPEFYERAGRARLPVVETVAHHAGPGDSDLSSRHVMAWAPLSMAPWAVALGASERETLVTIDRLRRVLLASGAASLSVLLASVGYAWRRSRPTDTQNSAERRPGSKSPDLKRPSQERHP